MHRDIRGPRRRPGPATARSFVLAAVLLLVAVIPISATWSIIAVDRTTGQIGAAGASCTRNVQGIAAIVPGKGAVVVQAMSSNPARERGVALLREGATPEQILAAMRDPGFDPENQQYAVLIESPEHPPVTYSGERTTEWRGALTGDGVAVQGNILVGEQVLTAALQAFRAEPDKPLAERLAAALAAGAEAGGDRRCGEQRATSAFVTVYRPDDADGAPFLHLGVYGIGRGGEPAVARLVKELERLGPEALRQRSTRAYIIPAPPTGW
jgi:hypothetical protein